MRSPKSDSTTKPKSGSSRTRIGKFWYGCCQSTLRSMSPLHQVERVEVERVAVTVHGDDDGEADRGLRRRHRQHEEHQHLRVQGAERAAEGDERQVDRVQHE